MFRIPLQDSASNAKYNGIHLADVCNHVPDSVCLCFCQTSVWVVGGRIGGVLRAVLPYPVIQMAIARVQFDLGKVIQAQ